MSQAQTATGKIESTDGKNFTATFVINSVDTTYNATVAPAMQPFSSNNAKLMYNAMSDLTAERSYKGRIGTDDFMLTLENGPVMSGKLNAPGINPASLVGGKGKW